MVELYKETNFKETPIGKIPEDWEVVRLGEMITYIKGKKPKKALNEPKEGLLPYLSTEYLRSGIPTQFVELTGNEIIAEEGEILLLWDGSNAGEFFLAKKGVLSSTMVKISLKKEESCDKLFLFYLLKSREYFLKAQTKGTGIPHVEKNILNSLIIQLPSLPEQRKIAEILSTVDKAIEKTDEIIAKTERLKKGLMQELLTGRVRIKVENGKIRFYRETNFKDTEIGKVPEDWEVVKLGRLLELCQYGLSVPLKEKGKYPIIRMDEIIDGYVSPNISKYVDIDEKTFQSFRLEKGDVLFNRTNSYELVGRTGIFLLDGDYVFASYLIRLRPKRDTLHPHFLTFYLIFSHNRLKQLATKAVHQANINATNLKNFKIPLPPLSEQQKIAEILSTIDKKLELERKRKEKLERIKKGLMDVLLTGKVRVKV